MTRGEIGTRRRRRWSARGAPPADDFKAMRTDHRRTQLLSEVSREPLSPDMADLRGQFEHPAKGGCDTDKP